MTLETIEFFRKQFYCLSETEQTQHILNYMIEHSQGDDRSTNILYCVGGQTCYRMVYGLRYNRFTSIKAKFLNGIIAAEHGLLGKSQVRDASIRVTSWLRTFVEKVGDKMPTSMDIHLPSCLTKSDVCCNMSTFYNIWKRDFPHVKIPKVINIIV